MGDDYMEISRTSEDVLEKRPFDSQLDKSVVESDYSSDEEDFDDGNSIQGQVEAVSRGFMLGCYTPQEIENDLEYQQVVAQRWEAAVEDMREYEKGYDWDFL